MRELFERPAHPYTRALLSAVPIPDPVRQHQRQRIVLSGDIPDPARPPGGCRFHTRCPDVMDVCRLNAPLPATLPGGTVTTCHLHAQVPVAVGTRP
jgi:oligopeptide/dipeptide ABC transporter ATP-binding protein